MKTIIVYLAFVAIAQGASLRASIRTAIEATSNATLGTQDTGSRNRYRLWLGQFQPASGFKFSGDFYIANGHNYPSSLWESCWAWGGGRGAVDENGIDVITTTYAQMGGPGGVRSFDDADEGIADKEGGKSKAIKSIQIKYGHIVDSIEVTYGNFGSKSKHGGEGGVPKTIYVADHEGIDRVRVCAGQFVDSIGFRIKDFASGTTRVVSAGGNGGKYCKTYCPKVEGDILTAINGYEGAYLDALGVYFGKAPKDVCFPKAKAVKGKWVPERSVSKGETYTMTSSVTVGNERVESQEEMNSFAQSLSSTIEASGTYVSASVTMGVESQQAKTISTSLTKSFVSTDEISSSRTFERNGLLWKYVVEAETTCNNVLEVSLPYYQVTDDQDHPPCCTPTFFKGGSGTSDTGHRECVDSDKKTQHALCKDLKNTAGTGRSLKRRSCGSDIYPQYCPSWKRAYGCGASWMKSTYCKATCCA